MNRKSLKSASAIIGFMSGLIALTAALVFYFVSYAMAGKDAVMPTETFVSLIVGAATGLICMVASCFARCKSKFPSILQLICSVGQIACIILVAMAQQEVFKVIGLSVLPFLFISTAFMVIAAIAGLMNPDKALVEKKVK